MNEGEVRTFYLVEEQETGLIYYLSDEPPERDDPREAVAEFEVKLKRIDCANIMARDAFGLLALMATSSELYKG